MTQDDGAFSRARLTRSLTWLAQLQGGALPPSVDPLVELRKLADDLDPADSLAVFVNVDVPEIDLPPADELD